MDDNPSSYWGKLRRSPDGIVSWLPLQHHLVDVAVMFDRLLSCGRLEVLARLSGMPRLSGVHRARLVVLAFLHDLGKMNVGFQARGFGTPMDKSSPRPRGHVLEAVGLIASDAAGTFMTEFGLADLRDWFSDEGVTGGNALVRALLCSWSHHGRPAPATLDTIRLARRGHVDRDLASVSWSGWRYADLASAVSELRSLAERNWPLAFHEDVAIPLTPAFLESFNGLLTLADWMGSDASRFTYSSEGDRLGFSARVADDFVHSIGLDGIEDADSDFASVFGFEPNALQRAAIEQARTIQ